MTQNNKIICIAGIVLSFELVLYELIEKIHVHIRKNLRGQITDRQASSMKQIRAIALIAFNYFFKKPYHVWISNPFFQDSKQNIVIDTIKKLSNVALQGKTWLGEIFADFSNHFIYCFNSSMRTFANSAGKRIWNERWFKKSINYIENGMMKNSVSDRRLVNMPQLGVVNIKAGIRSMSIFSTFQISRKVKDISLEILLELLNVSFASFVAFELVPSSKQVLRFDNFIK